MLVPNDAEIRCFVRWRFAPYRPGYLVRVQIYGARHEQWRIALGDQPVEREQFRDPPHFRQGVASLEELAALLVELAQRAARYRADIAVAPALFEDAISMGKDEVQSWLGFGLDFDAKVNSRVGPVEGLERLIAAGIHPRMIVCTGSAWMNGHGAEPKLHALYSWSPPIPAPALDRAGRLLRRLTAEMGADPACAEWSRPLRLPGSIHPPDFDRHGREVFPAQLCRIVWTDMPVEGMAHEQ